MKKLPLALFTSLFLLTAYTLAALENSIIPLMEKFECIENLPQKKYPKTQYQEITKTLSHKKDRIRIMSYNLLFNKYDHNLAECNRWRARMPRVVELIKDAQADIIGVQELYKDQLDDLMPHMSDIYEFYAHACLDGELNGIFYRKERFEVIERKVWYMTKTPDSPSSETLTMLKLQDTQTGKSLALFNAHLAFSAIDKREFQARFIAHYVAKYTTADSVPVPAIVMGDFNTFPARLDLDKLPAYDGDYIHRILTQRVLKDVKEVSLLGHLGPLSTFTNAPNDTVPFTGLGTPGVFLDHIYVSKGVTVLLHATQSATVEGHFPSDHMPLIADVIPKQIGFYE